MTSDDPVQDTLKAVRQLRIVVEAEDYDEALRFYRDVLGLPEELAVESAGGARVAILSAGEPRWRSPTRPRSG